MKKRTLRQIHKSIAREWKRYLLDKRNRFKRHTVLGLRAASKIKYLVERGLLEPARKHDCVDCGDQANHYDHRDYREPCVVEPVCRGCNSIRGPALPLLRSEQHLWTRGIR
jgi:hypothetical protein